MRLYINRRPPKGKTIPLEVSYGQLPVTPSHDDLLRLGGLDFRITLTGQRELWPEGDQMESTVNLSGDKWKSLQESHQTPLEASHDRFLVTPPSHFAHQKAKG